MRATEKVRAREDREAAAARVIADGAVPVTRLCRSVPASRGERGHASPSALVRWIIHGKRGVHLDGCRLGGKTWCSSFGALARFAAAMSGDDPGPASPTEMEREAAAADREFDRLFGGRK